MTHQQEIEGYRSGLKIGILTFHRCINYGSYWQARCLVEGLITRGHDAVLLDHESKRVNFSEWKCALQPVLPLSVPKSDHQLYRQKMLKFFKVFVSLPLSARFQLDDPAEMKKYDYVVVGSDEVWNLFHPWYGKCSLFYGDHLNTRHLVSYAASFGNYPASWGLDAEWAGKLQNFDAISVRDSNSQTIIKNAIGLDVPLVLDPCLQFSVEPENRSLSHLPDKYVAVYGHNFSPFFIEQILKWAAHRNLPLVSIGYRNDWADEQWITADPHDFAHFISGSEAIATNFFHGCVFALKNAKPFVCETSPYRSIKVQGLMEKVGGEKHMVTEETRSSVYSKQLNEPVSQEILYKIDRIRESSDAYLDMALNIKQLKIA